MNKKTQEETIFMTKYGINEMEFYCDNDNMYEARFTDENGETFTFNSSRAKVMEHVERFAKHPELYITNKTLVVAHFHAMALAFYAMAHLPKER